MIFILFFINAQAHPKKPGVIKNDQGAVMIYLISVILTMAVLGSAMLNLITTSTLGQVSANHMDRAYFMAEAGGHYATSLVKDDIASSSNGTYQDIYTIHEQTFFLDNMGTNEEGQFTIEVTDTLNFTLIKVIGAINAGVSTNVEAQITYYLAKTLETLFNLPVFGGSTINIKKDVYIDGDVATNDTSISTANGVTITGDQTTSAGRTLESITFSCASCIENLTIKSDETWYGNNTYEFNKLANHQGTTITISGQVTLLVADDFTVAKESTFRFLEDASLTIYIDKNAVFDKEFTTQFTPEPDRPQDFVIYGTSNSDTITIKKESTFIGAIYAPDASILINKESAITGSIIGDEITLNKEVTITWDPNVSLVPAPAGGVGTRLDLLSQYFSQGT